jgi:glycerol-3-phosphate acyltransferase PlsY
MSAWHALWVMALGYALGAVPFAYLLPRYLGGVDVRALGSGNVGAANVFRTTRLTTALMVIALDMGKGALAVWAAAASGAGLGWQAAAGVTAVVGHMYSAWLRFKGGKGVATACGVFAVLAPVATLAAMVVFVGTVWATRYVSAGSLAAVVGLVGGAWAAGADVAVTSASVVVGVLVVWKHRANIARLVAGRERRLGERA